MLVLDAMCWIDWLIACGNRDGGLGDVLLVLST